MAATCDLTTDVGRARLLIGDRDVSDPMFSDEELAAIIEAEGGSVYLGAALALDTIAVNEVLVQKAITILGLTTNGPSVAAALGQRADKLRELDGNEIVMDFAQMALTANQVVDMWVAENWNDWSS
jgi:hypothetical protein